MKINISMKKKIEMFENYSIKSLFKSLKCWSSEKEKKNEFESVWRLFWLFHLRMLDDDSQWRENSLKSIEKLTLTLIDTIIKRNVQGNHWSFGSTNPWILLYRVAIKFVSFCFRYKCTFIFCRRDPTKDELFLVSFVRTVHEFFGKSVTFLLVEFKSNLILTLLLEKRIVLSTMDGFSSIFSSN